MWMRVEEWQCREKEHGLELFRLRDEIALLQEQLDKRERESQDLLMRTAAAETALIGVHVVAQEKLLLDLHLQDLAQKEATHSEKYSL